ncbi:hypothetical protein M0802_015093 [Mischocyttarus mexicanus]|nr:hypothetical protein M0802_015093 [Mischocyttarus mexicanus]
MGRENVMMAESCILMEMGIGTGASEMERKKVVDVWVRVEGMVTKRVVWTKKRVVALEDLMELVGIDDVMVVLVRGGVNEVPVLHGEGGGGDCLRSGGGEEEALRFDRVVTAKRVLVCVLSESAVLPVGVGTTTGRMGPAKYLFDAWMGVVIPSEFFPNPVPTICP